MTLLGLQLWTQIHSPIDLLRVQTQETTVAAQRKSQSERLQLDEGIEGQHLRLASSDTEKVPSSTKRYGDVYASDNARLVLGDVIHNHFEAKTPQNLVQEDKLRREREKHEKCERLLKSLMFERMDARLWNVESALVGTCRWFFRHPSFVAWKDHPKNEDCHGFLWIKGKPGCGKSTIMKSVYDHVQSSWHNEITVSYFFNGRAHDELERSSLGLYKSLAYQLLLQLSEGQNLFVKRFWSKDQDGLVGAWTTAELQGLLFDLLTKGDHNPVNIFVDALDEGQENDVRQMVAFFGQLGAAAQTSKSLLRICLSSRHYPSISIRKGLSMILEHQNEHAADIQLYVKTNLHDDYNSSMTFDLGHEVYSRSQSVFLWAVLVIPLLNATFDQGGTPEEARDLLWRLPTKLDALFAETLAKDAEGIQYSVLLLQWVLFSKRPLTPEELYFAIRHNSPSSPPNKDDILDKDRLKRHLLHVSRGLVEIKEGVRRSLIYRTSHVQLIHETVRTFLLGTAGLRIIDPTLSSNLEGFGHDTIKNGCLNCIQRQPYLEPGHCEDSKSQLQDTLIGYTTENLFHHANLAQRYDVDQKMFLQAVKNDREKITSRWYQAVKHKVPFHKKECPPNAPLLYYLACEGYSYLVRELANQDVDIDASAGLWGSALIGACAYQRLDIVKLLLETGAAVDAKPGRGKRTALSTACELSQPELVKLLLDAGADINARTSQGTALRLASFGNRPSMVKYLLTRGANIHFHDPSHGTALSGALLKHNYEVVKVLLFAGADPNYRVEPYGSALELASFLGMWETVDLLLRTGAKVPEGGFHFRSRDWSSHIWRRDKWARINFSEYRDWIHIEDDGCYKT